MNPHIDALERLFALKEQGALNETEFDKQKSQILISISNQKERSSLNRLAAIGALVSASLLVVCIFYWLVFSLPNTKPMVPPPKATLAPPKLPIRVTREVARPASLPNLDAILNFEKPSNCRKSNSLYNLFWRMVRIDRKTGISSPGKPITVPGFAQPIIPTFDRNHEVSDGKDVADVIAKLPLLGRWHGLQVQRLFLYYGESSSLIHYQIDFKEKPKVVKLALDAAGFKLNQIGKIKVISAKAANSSIDVGMYVDKSLEGGSSLVCSTEFNYGS